MLDEPIPKSVDFVRLEYGSTTTTVNANELPALSNATIDVPKQHWYVLCSGTTVIHATVVIILRSTATICPIFKLLSTQTRQCSQVVNKYINLQIKLFLPIS
tara:strand:- start:347 stop:652 length:306 start_codon:yes stop_codon:yes gene_type:complete